MYLDKLGIFAMGLLAVALLVHPAAAQAQASPNEHDLARFEKNVEESRVRLGIPGLSALIIEDQKVAWAKGCGFADVAGRVRATPDTIYPIASLTKPVAATLVMQLVEQGKLDLDEPVSHYSGDFKDDSVRIKHLLTHTSNGTPGEKFEYDGGRFDYLTAVIEKKMGKTFREAIVKNVLDPLGMSSSVPGPDVLDEPQKWLAPLGKDDLDRYRSSLSKVAQPYRLYGASEIVRVFDPPKSFGAAAGLLSTVSDLAKFDIAIDRHVLIRQATQEKAWTAFVSNGGERLPYGLGWFVEDYRGVKLIWHYGHWGTGFSALYVKAPQKKVSLLMLANSEALADHQFVKGENPWVIGKNVFGCSFMVFAFGEGTDCEQASQAALNNWIDRRRADARTAVQVDPRILETYVGQYRFEEFDRTLTITREGGRLFVDIPASDRSEVFAESETKFFLKTRPMHWTFVMRAGKVASMDFFQDEEPFHANRIR
jgi:CubicO group peptidase (beta-lactamase class C family)